MKRTKFELHFETFERHTNRSCFTLFDFCGSGYVGLISTPRNVDDVPHILRRYTTEETFVEDQRWCERLLFQPFLESVRGKVVVLVHKGWWYDMGWSGMYTQIQGILRYIGSSAASQSHGQLVWAARNFLHRFSLSWDATSVACALPDDLREALWRLRPVGTESAELVDEWQAIETGEGGITWEQMAPKGKGGMGEWENGFFLLLFFFTRCDCRDDRSVMDSKVVGQVLDALFLCTWMDVRIRWIRWNGWMDSMEDFSAYFAIFGGSWDRCFKHCFGSRWCKEGGQIHEG